MSDSIGRVSTMRWRLCCCCGKSAHQYVVHTSRHGKLYPDVCDVCWSSCLEVTDGRGGDVLWDELERRRGIFDATFEVIGFRPIIVRRPITFSRE